MRNTEENAAIAGYGPLRNTVVVALDPQECVLPNLGEVVPRPGVDELFLVGREE